MEIPHCGAHRAGALVTSTGSWLTSCLVLRLLERRLNHIHHAALRSDTNVSGLNGSMHSMNVASSPHHSHGGCKGWVILNTRLKHTANMEPNCAATWCTACTDQEIQSPNWVTWRQTCWSLLTSALLGFTTSCFKATKWLTDKTSICC